MAASLLCDSTCVLHNCPVLSDVKTSEKILQHLGCRTGRSGSDVLIDPRGVEQSDIPAVSYTHLAKAMSEILPYLGVEAKYTEEELAKLDTSTPDVLGKNVQEAQNTLQSAELDVKVYGQGETVLSQVPEPGKSIPKSGCVVLFTDEESTSQTVTVQMCIRDRSKGDCCGSQPDHQHGEDGGRNQDPRGRGARPGHGQSG